MGYNFDMVTNLASQLEETAARHPQKTAFIFKQNSLWKTITYQEFLVLEKQLERGLLKLGAARYTRSVLMLPPGIPFFALAFALLKIGVSLVIIDPAIGLTNVTTCLDQAQADLFIGNALTHTLRRVYGWGKKSVRQNLTLYQLLHASGSRSAAVPPAPKVNPEAAVIYTSGSTGLPRGAIYTHDNLLAQKNMLVAALNLHGNEIDLPAFPIFALIDLLLGVTAVVPDLRFPRPGRVDPQLICEAVQKFQVQTLFASPVVLDRMAAYGRQHPLLLSSLDKVVTAGAPAPLPVLQAFRKLLQSGTKIFGIYGATEALPITLINCREILAETRFATQQGAGICVGKPVKGMQVKIMPISDGPVACWNDGLELLPPGVGEIVVGGPAVTAAYAGPLLYDQLAKMDNPPGGSLHRTGDLGWFDEQGRLWYCGRKSQRVETTGGTLFTEAVEGIFNVHPRVYRTALVGVKQAGQVVPVLWVELKPGPKRKVDMIRQQLLDIAAQHEMTRQVKTILFRSTFPTDVRHNSKIIREQLAQAAQRRVK